MDPMKYLNTVLTLIAVLLIVIVFGLAHSYSGALPSPFVEPAFAQAQGNQDVVFSAWFNPRRFIFWDKPNGLIYIYDDNGKIDATWIVGKMGEPLRKK